MNRKSSLSSKILMLISLTSLITCILVTIAGAAMIYVTTENGIKTELEGAAHSLYSMYDYSYPGEFHMLHGSFCKGDIRLTDESFRANIEELHCSSDIDFTLFWGDESKLTNVDGGKSMIGTKAAEEVSEAVLSGGSEYYSRGLKINNSNYFGYYIPIKHPSGKTVGMVFAGKPTIQAEKNMRTTISMLVVISLSVLVAAIMISSGFSSRMVRDLLEIKLFMEDVSKCSFDTKLKERALTRKDEVGDIARSALTLQRSLRDLIMCDPLTSLLNRRSCRGIIQEIIDSKKLYSVAMGDIDFFKKINDTFGHACGDMVLRDLSAILKDEGGKINARVSRWGGEEFLLVFPGTNLIDMYATIEKIMIRVRSTEFMWEGERVPVTMTIGAVEAIRGESMDDTINRADNLLYEGKRTGRNRIVIDDNRGSLGLGSITID